jgi:hypothetical protein
MKTFKSVPMLVGWVLVPALLLGTGGCGDDEVAPLEPAAGLTLDSESLYNGALWGLGFGRCRNVGGSADPAGAFDDFQTGQMITARYAGVLSQLRLPIRNLDGATEPVELQLRMLQNGIRPEPDDGLVLGAVSLPASAFVGVLPDNPQTWAAFDVSAIGLELAPGREYCFTVSTADTLGFVYSVEMTMNYGRGSAFRRNRAFTAEWSEIVTGDLGFQAYIDVR